MKNNRGYIRVTAASPVVRVADSSSNAEDITALAKKIFRETGSSIAVFPELCVTGYSCAELFNQQILTDSAEDAVRAIASETADLPMMIAVGAPVRVMSRLYNAAIIIKSGKIMGMVPKAYLPGNSEFYETRYFESGYKLGKEPISIDYAGQKGIPFGILQLFRLGNATVTFEICQDLWVPIPPSTYATLSGADIVVNLSASDEEIGKQETRRQLVGFTSARQISAYIYSSCGYGESTGDLSWGASSMIFENGCLLAENERFQNKASRITADIDIESLQRKRTKYINYSRDGVIWADAWPFTGSASEYKMIDCGNAADTDFSKQLFREVDPHPFTSGGPDALAQKCREAFSIQVSGLMTRLEHINCRSVVIGVSGGLDSTLALLVAAEAFDRLGWDRKGILAVTMPGFGTSERTHTNADILMEETGAETLTIDITEACRQHFNDIGHDISRRDTTFENAQARERTQILMDLANSRGGIVVGTGDMSELALGWCTYNGDQMSMYGVNAGVPKTLIREIVHWYAKCKTGSIRLSAALEDVVATPVSPELTDSSQATEDLVGPYELHDFFLYHFTEGEEPSKILFLASRAFEGKYDSPTVRKWLEIFIKRFFTQQFKRSAMPDGPKVCPVSLSPRGDWRMSSDSKMDLWLSELASE